MPADAGWWSPATLTEDIEFSLRVYLRTPWAICYEPRFLVQEEPPATWAALVRQRGRWARGWSQVASLHLRPLLRQPDVPARRRFGLGSQLVAGISATWSVFLPVLLVAWLWDRALQVPAALAVALGLVILPSRLLTHVHPYFRDPVEPVPVTWRNLARTAALAYAWVAFGWMLQLQALYQEVSGAPRVWHPTRSGAPSASAGGAAEARRVPPAQPAAPQAGLALAPLATGAPWPLQQHGAARAPPSPLAGTPAGHGVVQGSAAMAEPGPPGTPQAEADPLPARPPHDGQGCIAEVLV